VVQSSFRTFLVCAAAVLCITGFSSPSQAAGQIDASTLVWTSHGNFNGVPYLRYEAMFQGVTQNQRPYRVPCQIIAPVNPSQGSGLLLFDWLVPSTIWTAVGQEQADARYTMTDEFLFGRGVTYATVRCNPDGLGTQSPIVDHTRPWSDDLLDTSSEFITSAGDEFDIVVDYVKALKTDPVAVGIIGPVNRSAAFGYSASGSRLRGLLRHPMGKNLFAFSLVGGAGNGYALPAGNSIGFAYAERLPLAEAGLEIDFQSETDVVFLGGHKTRLNAPNYRTYEFAGAAHIRDIDAAEFGLADPHLANPADWVPFFRSMFVIGNNWCDGIAPPPSIWLGAPNQAQITRDAKGNALVRYVGGQFINTTAYRLPEVAVGENQYIPLDPSYNDGSFLGVFRMIGGGHVDLTASITNHAAYVNDVTIYANQLRSLGYLLDSDADAIIQRAIESDIGN